MKRLILASSSPQRRALMGFLGLPFTVRAAGVAEATVLSKGIAFLVKHNALIKARAVAVREKRAIVIGADTVVYSSRRRLILKPANLAQARANLKELMAGPHWVYSGIALVDADSGKTLAAHEKTKVFMTPLSDKAIVRYHRLVSPLDKAGGFDIEGKGALFIPRIEGCYYNVVGLPLARLTMMLKQFGIQAL